MFDKLKEKLFDILEEEKANERENHEDSTSAFTWQKYLIILGILFGGILLLKNSYSYMLPDRFDQFEVQYYLLLIGLVSYWIATKKLSVKSELKSIGLWIGVFFLLMILYSFRFEIIAVKNRIVQNLNPSMAVEGTDSLSVRLSQDGHFYLVARIHGQRVRFLVDTGASRIVLTPQVAEKLGYDVNDLSFGQVLQTANGEGRATTVILRDLQVGTFYLQDIPVSINQATMEYSLLGMDFFNRLQSYRVEKGVLTLKW